MYYSIRENRKESKKENKENGKKKLLRSYFQFLAPNFTMGLNSSVLLLPFLHL